MAEGGILGKRVRIRYNDVGQPVEAHGKIVSWNSPHYGFLPDDDVYGDSELLRDKVMNKGRVQLLHLDYLPLIEPQEEGE